MVRLIGHRQTKGAATAMLRPTVTAPHLDSTEGGCSAADGEGLVKVTLLSLEGQRKVRGTDMSFPVVPTCVGLSDIHP